jgi:protein-disulfide isomerase
MVFGKRLYTASFFLLVWMAGERPLMLLTTLTAPPQQQSALFQPRVAPASVSVYPPREDDRFVGGSTDNSIVVIAYLDFGCAECAKQYEALRGLYVGLDGQVSVIYRHFPATMSPHDAAHAAECVGEQLGQDGFDRFADIVFMNQKALSDLADPFPQLAETVGANRAAFALCTESQRHAARIKQHVAEASEQASAAPLLIFLNVSSVQAAVFRGLHSLDYLKQVFQMMQDTTMPAKR